MSRTITDLEESERIELHQVAWAWGANRVMDYLQSDAQIDARRVAVVGHSRGGKTAL